MSDPPPEDDRLAVPPATGLASSLERARIGQMMMLDPAGNVAKPRMLMRPLLLMLGLVLGSMLITNLAVALTGNLMAAYLGPVVLMAVVVPWLWIGRRLRRGFARLSAGDLVGAEQAALSVARSRLAPRLIRGNAWLLAGAAKGLRGDQREALVLTQRALALLPTTGAQQGLAVLARLNEVQFLALCGELPRARERIAELEREGLLDGDLVRMQWIDTRLVLAFETGDASTLPDELETWARDVLATNRFGSTLVLLAWALRERGKPDLVPVLLDVARDRLSECHIETAHPRLAAWHRDATQPHPQ